MGLMWLGMPAVVYGLVAMTLLPSPRPPSRWRSWLEPLRSVALRRHGHREPSPAPPDPFAVLNVQLRLGVVATQVQALEVDPDVWGRGRRMKAAQAAYDALLLEACCLAGVEHDPSAPRSEPERFRAEMELASRGWSW